MIHLQNISVHQGTKVLLENASAILHRGDKCALIGPNGCGKSTLFSVLLARHEVTAGEVSLPKGLTIVSIEQHITATEQPAIEFVMSGDQAIQSALNCLHEAEIHDDGEGIAEAYGTLETLGFHTLQARASAILQGLGFSQSSLNSPVSSFSGGWQMRLNLAKALLCPSDLLLLDEPTNHLDLNAVIWLESFLQTYPNTVMLISHDAFFINAICRRILAVEQHSLVSYTGNYDQYLTQKAMREDQAAAQYAKQQAQKAHLESFIRRFKAKASKAKQAQSRVKQLQRMQELTPPSVRETFSFNFLPPERVPDVLVKVQDADIGYDRPLLKQVNLTVTGQERIGLLGKNGQGKSTLIKLLSGQTELLLNAAPTQSSSESSPLERSKHLKLGYFAQHQMETLIPEHSPLQHLQPVAKQMTEQQLRDYLGGFNFHGERALEPIRAMSGGEKARLALAILLIQRPNLLLLDEPTNHLDIEMRDAICIALQDYQGAVMVVSHDRQFLASICDRFYLIDDGRVTEFEDDLDGYRQWLLTSASRSNGAAGSAKESSEQTQSANLCSTPQAAKLDKKQQAQLRQQTYPLRKAIEKTEKEMSQRQDELASVEAQLNDPRIYDDANKAKLKECLRQQIELKNQIEGLEMQWLELEEQVHAMEQNAVYASD